MNRLPRLRIKGPLFHPYLHCDISEMVQRSLDLLLQAEFRGIDPGSYYSPRFRRFHANGSGVLARAWNKGFHTIAGWGGIHTAKLFSLPEITSTKAAALTLSGLAALRGKPNICDPEQLEVTAEALIDWLVERRSQEVGAWTPDFQYEIRGVAISQNVLGTINTVFCTDALWQWRDRFPFVDELIVSAAEACMENLPRLENETKCCFSYNPSTHYYVHNANLFVALLMARALHINPNLMSGFPPVEKCVRYTLDDFERAGTLRYAAPPTVNNTVDNYHTGFVLRTLNKLSGFLEDEGLVSRIGFWINEGVNQYSKSFVKAHGVPKFKDSKHHIQAHSVAEALLVHDVFGTYISDLDKKKFEKSVQKSVEHLWNRKQQYFDSEVRVLGGVCIWRNSSPMPRWAWAWMFNALAITS